MKRNVFLFVLMLAIATSAPAHASWDFFSVKTIATVAMVAVFAAWLLHDLQRSSNPTTQGERNSMTPLTPPPSVLPERNVAPTNSTSSFASTETLEEDGASRAQPRLPATDVARSTFAPR